MEVVKLKIPDFEDGSVISANLESSARPYASTFVFESRDVAAGKDSDVPLRCLESKRLLGESETASAPVTLVRQPWSFDSP